ncbi:hypothetical protein SAMN02910369_00386 [Lachnospiraceae bacterium NE2001]|nr:hypothetical protein SAMN02910369_00386 [Lachnospiraceae bacterium NE2001]
MKKKYVKRITSLVLTAALCLSASACGNEDTVVDDYGSNDQKTESAETDAETSTGTDGISIARGDNESLRDFFGSKVSYQDDFTVGKTEFKGNASYDILDNAYVNVYNMHKISDGKKDEQAIVDSLFGDSAEKLDKIEYTDGYDYMTLLYKYRQILAAHETYKSSDEIRWVQYEKSIITSTTGDVYYWKDDDDIYIHMYEGDYQNTRFVLLLAYDYTADFRYIFFEPKNIREYFPNYEFETLMVSGSNDSAGNPLELDNLCSDSIETIKENAESFVNNELRLNGDYTISYDGRFYKNSIVDSIIDSSSPINMIDPFGSNSRDLGNSVLMFSDSDFISTIMTGVQGMAYDYRVLSKQRDLLQEYIEENPNSTKDYTDFVYSEGASKLMDIASYTVDGYAVYLESDSYFEDSDSISSESSDSEKNILGPVNYNSGIIKYTSNGLYSVDIRLSNKITDSIDNVQLLDFEKIKPCLQAAIEEELDLEKMGNPDTLEINSVYLSNVDYYEDPESDTYVSIPAWQFSVTRVQGDGNTAIVYLNAMDGSLVSIRYISLD